MTMYGITAVVVLTVFIAAVVVAAAPNQCLPCTDCAKCTGLALIAGGTSGKFRVTISVADCKNGSVSWLCCRSSASSGVLGNTPFNNGTCNLVGGCEFPSTQQGDKCNNFTQSLVYDVPFGATNITVQLHDGQFAGNVDCSSGTGCCGGAGGACQSSVSGVCAAVIDLTTCPPAPPQCTADDDCYISPLACADRICDNGLCKNVYTPGVKCREAWVAGDGSTCDRDEYCVDGSADCPADAFEPAGHECRAVAGECDVAETCTGSSAVCPHDVFHANTTVCRASAGPCDAEETCTGSSAACPADAKYPNGFECRAKDGVCDRADVCDGVNNECEDTVQQSDVICRPRVVADDGTSCDVDDYCDGSGKQCPLQDNVERSDTVCRPAADHCDVADVCDGVSPSCPANARNDFAYTYKCSTTQYLCGVTCAELGIVNGTRDTQNRLGNCGIGSSRTCVELPWPQCLDQCIQAKCPNQRGLSNFAEAVCNPSDGTWTCVKKVDVTSSTQLPYCPHDPTPTVLTLHGLVKTLETPAATTDDSPTPIQIAIVALAGVAVLILLVLLLWKAIEACRNSPVNGTSRAPPPHH